MPLKLIPPRKGKSPNWSIRGTYLGVYVDKSCGTDRRPLARSRLSDLEGRIERGEYPPRELAAGEPTFLSAAVAYLETPRSKRQRKLVAKLIKYFGEKPLREIGQTEIDEAAIKLHPGRTAATRNQSVYTPTVAIMRNAGLEPKIRRPKGAKGRVVTDYLTPADAKAIIAAAQTVRPDLALLLVFLLYTGVRLGTALAITWERVDFEKRTAWVGTTKNGKPITVRLRPDLAKALAARKGNATVGKVFRFHQGGNMKHLLVRVKFAALGIPCPPRRPDGWKQPPNRLAWCNYHTFRHTFATWFRMYGGGDIDGLIGLDLWQDRRSAARYAHVVPRDEWDRVDDLPDVKVG